MESNKKRTIKAATEPAGAAAQVQAGPPAPSQVPRAGDPVEPPVLRAGASLRLQVPLDDEIGQPCLSKPLWSVLVGAILLSTFLFALGHTIVADFQSPIIEPFGNVGKLSWLGVSFVLSSAATINLWGKLYGIFSTKWLYLASLVLFEAGSALCGEAPNMNAFIVGRVIAGLGGTGIYLGCMSLMPLVTHPRHHSICKPLLGIIFAVGIVLGPIIGGAFAQNGNWRWAFRINLIVGAAFAPIYALLFTPYNPTYDESYDAYRTKGNPQPGKSFTAKVRQIDYLGAILNAGFMVCLTAAIVTGGNPYEWNSPQEIAQWVIGGILLLGFILQQKYKIGTTAKERIFPGDFLQQPILWLVFVMVFASIMAVFVPTYFLPLHCQLVRGDSPLSAALTLFPFLCMTIATAIGVGFGMAYVGYYKPWYMTGGFACSLGGCLLSMVNETTPLWLIRGFGTIMGIGAGIYGQFGFSMCQLNLVPARTLDATCFILLAQYLGMLVGLAVCGSVFQNNALSALQDLFPHHQREELRGALAGVHSDFVRKLPEELQTKVLHAIADAISSIYWLVIAVGIWVAFGSIFAKRRRVFSRVVEV